MNSARTLNCILSASPSCKFRRAAVNLDKISQGLFRETPRHGLSATYGTRLRAAMLRCSIVAVLGSGSGAWVAVLASLGHHQLVVPETELAPEIRKTGHRMADLAVAFSALF